MQELIFCLHSIPMTSSLSQLSKMRLLPLYGSRAANGVVVMTTKSGKQGKTNVSFRSDWVFSNMAIDYRLCSTVTRCRELLWTGLKRIMDYTPETCPMQMPQLLQTRTSGLPLKPSTGWTDWKTCFFVTVLIELPAERIWRQRPYQILHLGCHTNQEASWLKQRSGTFHW